MQGDAAYTRANLALVLAGFSALSLLYFVQPLLQVLARAFRVDAFSLNTGLLAPSRRLDPALRRQRSWSVGRINTSLMFTCSGRETTNRIRSAMSCEVS